MNTHEAPWLMLDLFLKSSLVTLSAMTMIRVGWRASAAARRGVWVVAFGILSILLGTYALGGRPNWSWRPVLSASIERMTAPAVVAAPPFLAGSPAKAAEPVAVAHEKSWLWQDWLAGLWWLGSLAIMGHRLLGEWQLIRLRRGSQPITDARVLHIFEEARSGIGVRDCVALRQSSQCPVPMMWGWLRPVVMLPASVATGSDSRLTNVLRHELAHVRHRDVPARWLTTLACALHWWNPLVWIAARSFRQAQEETCDEAVLRQGSDPIGYAQDLMETVGLLRAAFPVGGVAMAKASTLRKRVMLILDDTRVRKPLSLWVHGMLMIFGVVAGVPCLMIGADAVAATTGAKSATSKSKLIGITVRFFECNTGIAEQVRKTAGLSDKTTIFIPTKAALSPILRELLKNPGVSITSYPRMVTLSEREVKIRSVVNVPQEKFHGTAYKRYGTEIDILPSFERGGRTLSVDISSTFSRVGGKTGRLALVCNGLAEEETIMSLAEDGNSPLVSEDGKLMFLMVSFEIVETASEEKALDLTSQEMSKMERSALQAKLQGPWDFLKADAGDVARYAAAEARSKYPELGIKLVVIEEGAYPQVSFLLDQPTLHQVMDVLEAAGVQVEYGEDFIKVQPPERKSTKTTIPPVID